VLIKFRDSINIPLAVSIEKRFPNGKQEEKGLLVMLLLEEGVV
jgi:hypothetical protein